MGKLNLVAILKTAAKPVSFPTIMVIIQNMCLRMGLFKNNNYTMPLHLVPVSEFTGLDPSETTSIMLNSLI